MANFLLFIPDDAQRGGSIAAADFAAAADELLSKALESDLSDELAEQARAAVEAAKALVSAGHAGAERVIAVISSRVHPDAVPAGTGHIVSIELSSRPSPPAAEPEAAPAAEAAPAESTSADEVDATQGALDHAAALGVDLAQIKGTGKDGRVTKADVEAAVAGKATDQPTS